MYNSGFHSKDNGIPPGSIRNFTVLVGVVLSPALSPFCGNFCVYPRSHRVLQNYFRQHGFDGVCVRRHVSCATLPFLCVLVVSAKSCYV